MMKLAWQPTIVSMNTVSRKALQDAIQCAAKGEGVLILEDFVPNGAPFAVLEEVFASLKSNPEFGERFNAAYTKNLAYKDSYAVGRGGSSVDEKRVLDLSPQRIEQIQANDPTLMAMLGAELQTVLKFFVVAQDLVVNTLLPALSHAITEGQEATLFKNEHVRYNYRMVDYYTRSIESAAPRCGEHTDFGPMTLIFQDGTPGLEVEINGAWHAIDPSPNSAVMLFGLCTAWRSNDRLKAVKHRVTNPSMTPDQAEVPRRLSMVLFVGLENNAELSPYLLNESETAIYKTATVADVHPRVARKWQKREGTVTEAQIQLENEEAKLFPTQESLIAHLYKIPAETF